MTATTLSVTAASARRALGTDTVAGLLDPTPPVGGGADPNMRAAEFRDVADALLSAMGQVFTDRAAAGEALFDDRDGGGFGISTVVQDAVLDALTDLSPPPTTDSVAPPPLPAGVAEQLGLYVYALVDPRDHTVFYIGKGTNERIYDHVRSALAGLSATPDRDAAVESRKVARIRDITAAGAQVQHYVLRYNIRSDTDDKTAYAIEQVAIEALRLTDTASTLTNAVGGHVATDLREHRIDELALQLSAPPAPALPDQCAVVVITTRWSPGDDPDTVYRHARDWWRAGRLRDVPDLPVLAVAHNIVRGVFRAHSWTRQPAGPDGTQAPVYRFDGSWDDELAARFLGHSVAAVREARPDRKWRQHGWHPYDTPGASHSVDG